ncbi:MAG: inositol oxygenase family protein [Gammaproteobacteria bacterium]|nr:inositol oxygenase family protein [Gammaproteobacteria bacterium]
MQGKKDQFRDYSKSEQVERTYQHMQENQTAARVAELNERYTTEAGYTDCNGNKIRETIMDVFKLLDQIIDESDPDTDLPQSFHAYQTGEALKDCIDPDKPTQLKPIPINHLFSDEEWKGLPDEVRESYYNYLDELYPEIENWSWLPLIGFIHDLGKVLALQNWGKLPQSFVVGDTFPIGAPFSQSNVYYKQGFFKKNPDLNFEEKSDNHLFGKYEMHTGFDHLDMSFGHDEYMYSVLKRTIHHLPKEALYLIRFHSFYPWHTPRDGKPRGYTELASAEDWRMLPLLKLFQQCDLYSKKAKLPNKEQLKKYYDELIKHFIPGRECEYDLRSAKLLW